MCQMEISFLTLLDISLTGSKKPDLLKMVTFFFFVIDHIIFNSLFPVCDMLFAFKV